jgi:hypothetical protein
MKRTALALTVMMALVCPTVAGILLVNLAKANPGPATGVPPVVSVSKIQVHATISQVNGKLWAKVDATYYMNTIHAFGDKFQTANYKMGLIKDPSPFVTVTVTYDKLEAYYPFPSDATNISVKMDGAELKLVSRNRSFHLFGDGNLPELTWTMSPVPRNFLIEVHYDHPIGTINGIYSYLGKCAFLFSLGARYGLDDIIYGYYGYYWFDNSTAQFDIRVEPPFNQIYAYSIAELNPLNSTLNPNPLNCTVSTENGTKRVEFTVSTPASTLYQSLNTSGVAVFLNETPEISEPFPAIPAITASGACVAVSAVVLLVYFKKRKHQSSPSSTISNNN